MKKGRAALAGADTKEADDGGKSGLIGYKPSALSENAASAILRWLAGRRQ